MIPLLYIYELKNAAQSSREKPTIVCLQYLIEEPGLKAVVSQMLSKAVSNVFGQVSVSSQAKFPVTCRASSGASDHHRSQQDLRLLKPACLLSQVCKMPCLPVAGHCRFQSAAVAAA